MCQRWVEARRSAYRQSQCSVPFRQYFLLCRRKCDCECNCFVHAHFMHCPLAPGQARIPVTQGHAANSFASFHRHTRMPFLCFCACSAHASWTSLVSPYYSGCLHRMLSIAKALQIDALKATDGSSIISGVSVHLKPSWLMHSKHPAPNSATCQTKMLTQQSELCGIQCKLANESALI